MKFQSGGEDYAFYTTVEGDVLDLIAFNFYGHHDGTTELVLQANPGLAALGLVLPIGIEVVLPSLPVTSVTPAPAITLWT